MHHSFQGLILDLDGTVYRGEHAVEGAPEFLRRLKDEGVPFVFATNRANRSAATIARTLRGYGLECSAQDVVTAATATADFLRPVGTVFVIGESALRQAMSEAGFEESDENPDYVVVGLDCGLTYQKLNTAVRSVLAGSKLVATNPDLIINAGDGFFDIGNGSIVAAITAATRCEPLVIGKPHAPLLEAALAKLGLQRDRVLVVGDNLATDIAGGHRAGFPTALIFTGVSQPSDVELSDVRPDFQVHDYEELAGIVLSGAREKALT